MGFSILCLKYIKFNIETAIMLLSEHICFPISFNNQSSIVLRIVRKNVNIKYSQRLSPRIICLKY